LFAAPFEKCKGEKLDNGYPVIFIAAYTFFTAGQVAPFTRKSYGMIFIPGISTESKDASVKESSPMAGI
jgi:hypothetical protein